ncbi:hypothetical protein G6Z20_14920 [Clostridium perfringens]|uniref:hypothetical protein n=1 Tax=Clostridium perfringens TaxID=1502 RepID=UPI0013E2D0F9|nr:hypothetical protein [Clostridium perfringens]MDB2046486.1 hypothetical protein [Clostridium perfringens]MDB2057086.1 hypothetical protein [Clostridium perfringens]NGT07393.1 hypothetical protein [Clostridium perfringens]
MTTDIRKALSNACINTSREIDISEDKRLDFIRLRDQLTEMDLKLLLYFENPLKRFEEKGEHINILSGRVGVLKEGIYKFYPELNGQDDAIENRIENLDYLGLIDICSINTVMNLNGVYDPRLTELGREFISFIKENA